MPNVLRPRLQTYKTIGVRFIYGPDLNTVYTYRVRKGAKLHLGQELVVPSVRGKRVAVVVELHTEKKDTGPFNYLFIEQMVAPL